MAGDLVGIAEIAELAGVSRAAVVNWRTRHSDFPSPVTTLQAGPVFSRDQVRKWLRARRGPVTTTIATINLKGGVGKTTTTVALGEVMAGEMGKRVLIIDLDPQTKATAMLIGEERWGRVNEYGNTIGR